MVLPMKIKVTAISNREHNVKTTNRNMEKMYDLQLLMAKADDVADMEPVEIIKMQRDMLHNSIEFLTTVLNLNKQEIDKLGNLEFADTIQVVNYTFERMMGMSDEDIDLATKKADASKSKD
jgi:putative NADH-flavin reductase